MLLLAGALPVAARAEPPLSASRPKVVLSIELECQLGREITDQYGFDRRLCLPPEPAAPPPARFGLKGASAGVSATRTFDSARDASPTQHAGPALAWNSSELVVSERALLDLKWNGALSYLGRPGATVDGRAGAYYRIARGQCGPIVGANVTGTLNLDRHGGESGFRTVSLAPASVAASPGIGVICRTSDDKLAIKLVADVSAFRALMLRFGKGESELSLARAATVRLQFLNHRNLLFDAEYTRSLSKEGVRYQEAGVEVGTYLGQLPGTHSPQGRVFASVRANYKELESEAEGSGAPVAPASGPALGEAFTQDTSLMLGAGFSF